MINADVDKAILEHYGITPIENNEKYLPKKCFICEFPNSSDSKICSKCGKALDMKTALEQDQIQEDELSRLRHRIEALEEKIIP